MPSINGRFVLLSIAKSIDFINNKCLIMHEEVYIKCEVMGLIHKIFYYPITIII